MPHLNETEIEDLLRSMASNRESGVPSGVAAHFESCPECAALWNAHIAAARDVDSLNRLTARPDRHACPEMGQWLQFMAGLLQPSESQRLQALAAECANCAESLRAAGTYLNPTEPLPQLEASSSAWQHQMALEMVAPRHFERPKPRPQWWFAISGAVACAALAFLLVNNLRRQDTNLLLAMAYTADRRTEMRFPGAQWAPVRQLRSNHQSSAAEISPLDKAKQVLPSICQNQETARNCLLYRANIDIVAGNYEPALGTLSQIHETPESHDLLLAHALAAFEKAADEPSPAKETDCAKVAEDLSRVLDATPTDPVALFNRAVVFEKLNLVNQAIADLEAFLKIEKDPKWAAEARGLFDDLQKKKLNAP